MYEGKIGDILICRGRSWISRAIMKITKGEWSHTALYAETWGQPGVIEAQKNGVNFKLWGVWRDKWGYEFTVFRPILHERTERKVYEHRLMMRAFDKCGETKYDFFTFFRRAFGNRKERSDVKEQEKFICSEFTAYVHQLPEAYDMTPQEQFEYLSNHPQWERIY